MNLKTTQKTTILSDGNRGKILFTKHSLQAKK